MKLSFMRWPYSVGLGQLLAFDHWTEQFKKQKENIKDNYITLCMLMYQCTTWESYETLAACWSEGQKRLHVPENLKSHCWGGVYRGQRCDVPLGDSEYVLITWYLILIFQNLKHSGYQFRLTLSLSIALFILNTWNSFSSGMKPYWSCIVTWRPFIQFHWKHWLKSTLAETFCFSVTFLPV